MMLASIAKNFWKDLTKKKLLPVKLFYLLMTGANQCLLPYLTLHLRSLGISFTEIALIYTILPLITWPGPSIAGYLADRFGNMKILAGITLILSAVSANFLLLVPNVNNNIREEEPLLNLSIDITSSVSVFSSLIAPATDCISSLRFNATIIQWPCNTTHNATLLLKPINEQEMVASVLLGDMFDECWVSVREGSLCNSPTSNTIDSSFTLWLYFCLRLVSSMMIGITSSFNECLCLIAVRQQDGDYGLLRFWGALGICILSPVTGVLMDSIGFSACFYLYGLIKIALVGLLYFLPLGVRLPDKKLNKNVRLILCNGQAAMFLVAMFCAGTVFGFLESYLFVFLDESLHATKSLMGISVMVANLAGLPFYLLSTFLIKQFGHVNLLLMGFVCYAIRCIGFSIIQDPYWCLPFELLESLTFGLMIVVAVTYAAHVAPSSALATIQGMWGGLHFILGKGVGAVAGGLLFNEFGARTTFRILAVFSSGVGIMYGLVYHCFLKARGTVVEQHQKLQENNGLSIVAKGSSSNC